MDKEENILLFSPFFKMSEHPFRKPVKKQLQTLGVTLDCACVHCDYYQDEIWLGPAGTEGYYFPALDSERRKIVAINIYPFLKIEEYKSPDLENPELARMKSQNKFPYFEKEMFESNENENEMISAFPHLQSKFNRCPACGKPGLQFCLEEVLD